jgi:sugar lactone lactonase YvrE
MYTCKLKSLAILAAALLALLSSRLQSQNLLNGPESAAYDPVSDSYFVSNIRDGKIIKVNQDGSHEEFKKGYGICLGNCISGRTLYFTSGTRIYGVDLDSGNEVANIRISDATNLDGITSDNNGNLYVVETLNDKIFKVDPVTKEASLFAIIPSDEFPQDIVYDKFKDRLLVVSYKLRSPIMQISLIDSSVSVAVTTNAGEFDGITIDSEGNVYTASHWGGGSIFKFDNDFVLPPERISHGHSEPAGLDYDAVNNVISVPEFAGDKLSIIDLNITSVEFDNNPVEYSLHQNFPNPFNPSTRIDYYIPESTIVTLKIYDLTGSLVTTLINERKEKGYHSVEFDGKGLSAGTYFYSFRAGSYSNTKKMTLIK